MRIIVLAVVIECLMAGCASSSDNVEQTDNIKKYNSAIDFKYLIWGYGKSQSIEIKEYKGLKKEVSIPPEIREIPVTTIGADTFWHNKNITSVTIPDSVTNIKGGAFFGCSSLTSVTIPDSVTNTNAIGISEDTEGCIGLFLDLYGYRAGTYERRNNKWYYNGTVMAEPARLVLQRSSSAGDIRMDHFDKLIISNVFNTRSSYYISPGLHKISVYWERKSNSSNERSIGSVTFEYVFTFESAIYDLTGEVQGDKILFGIKKR